VSKIFQAFDGWMDMVLLLSWNTTTIFNARLFCNKQCHVAIVAALLVGNWTSLPSKLFAPKNW
jgi:hypothetical protein